MTEKARLDPIEDVIEDIRAGRMVILTDDEDRENEGDLIMAASCVTADDINFMAKYGRGLICLTLSEDRCEQLQLPLMVVDNNDKNSTNFTVSIEAAEGVTTGISAADRAATVLAAVMPDAKPTDIVMPGHIFPLKAQPGGVLTRTGHTEAGCDLARLAGFEPASVIVEILNEDGTMARYPELRVFADKHNIKMSTIENLIRYRIENEKNLERVEETHLETQYGDFRLLAFQEYVENEVHIALVRGDIQPDQLTTVRIQMVDTFTDVLGAQSRSGWNVQRSLEMIAKQDSGVLVLLNKAQTSAQLLKQIQRHKLAALGVPQPNDKTNEDLRTFGVGAQILADIGVSRMRFLGRERKVHGLAAYGLSIDEFILPE